MICWLICWLSLSQQSLRNTIGGCAINAASHGCVPHPRSIALPASIRLHIDRIGSVTFTRFTIPRTIGAATDQEDDLGSAGV